MRNNVISITQGRRRASGSSWPATNWAKPYAPLPRLQCMPLEDIRTGGVVEFTDEQSARGFLESLEKAHVITLNVGFMAL